MTDPARQHAGGELPGDHAGDEPAGQLHLRRWTMTTGSGTERATGSRAAVVLAAGDSQWEGTAESAGAIGALFDALDAALEDVLGGRVRLVAFDVHAIGEAEILVRTEFLDAGEHVVPAADVQSGGMLAQFPQYLVHFE